MGAQNTLLEKIVYDWYQNLTKSGVNVTGPMLRAKAEVENIKKRSEKEINNAYKFSTEGIFLDLIPIYESLDIAISRLCSISQTPS